MDRELYQPAVGKMIGTSAETIKNWELNHNQPEVHYWPAIISFLGYYPEADDGSLGYQIRRYRQQAGIAQKVLAKRIGVDEQTLWRIEKGNKLSYPMTVRKIESFLNLFSSRK